MQSDESDGSDLRMLREQEEGNVWAGLFWGTLFSIPLWMSVIGWVRLIARLF